MSRVFIFVDESWDVWRHFEGSSSSTYYQLNVVVASREMLWKIALKFSEFRYFSDAEKEIDTYLRGEQRREKIKNIFQYLSENTGVKFYIFKIYKERYSWPYYHDEEFDGKKLRNFIIRISLEKIFNLVDFTWFSPQRNIVDFESSELVIDRFLDNHEDEENLKSYLRGNYNLPNLKHIVQIDSEYSEHIQCADVIWKLVKRHVESTWNYEGLDFIYCYDISIPNRYHRENQSP